MSAGSRFCRLPGRPYTEVGGHSVVVLPERRTFCRIGPGAAALWVELDGRPLGEILGPHSAGDPAQLETRLELIRRWRALELIEEAALIHGVVHPPADVPAVITTISLRAGLDAQGTVLVVGAGVEGLAAVDVGPPAVASDRPLIGLVEVGAPAEASTTISASKPEEGRLDVLGVFAALLASVTDADLHRDGMADALATLAENLDGRWVTGGDPDGSRRDAAVASLRR